ncbi:MAG: hypothetical protein FXF54_01335, partial [Kosmotoga sp.]
MHFIYDSENDIGCLFSTDIISEAGLIRFDESDGSITTSSEKYTLYEDITPNASKVAFVLTENLPDYEIGDVILDHKTKELRKIIGKPEYHENYVVLYTERTDLREAFGELNLSFSDNLSEAEEVSGYYPQDLGVGLSFDKEITLINETSSSSTVYVGLNSKIGFNPKLIIELDLGRTPLLGGNYVDYLMAGFKGEFNFEAILRALVEYSYEKSGQTNPFISPSFHFTVGPVPVEIEMNIYGGYVFNAGVTGQATMGCSAKYITDFGIECISDNWDIYNNSDGSFKIIGPEFSIKGGITVKPYLMIETSMQIAFVAGPFFGLSPYIEGNAQASYSNYEEPIVDLSLNAGFLGTGGIVLDFAGWRTTIPDPDNPWQIFDIKKEIWSGEFAWPNAPANLTATANETSIILEWDDKSYVEDGFELYKKVSSKVYKKIIELNSNITSYIDNNVTLDEKYYYKVRSFTTVPEVNLVIPSLWSNEAIINTFIDENSLTVTTIPDTELEILIGGMNYTSPETMSFEEGEAVNIGVTSPQEKDKNSHVTGIDTKYTFKQWNDGNTDKTRTITINSDKTYTAEMEKEYKVETCTSPEGITTINGVGWYKAGTSKTFTTPDVNGYTFDHWEINGNNAGTNKQLSLTIDTPKKIIAIYTQNVDTYSLFITVKNEDGGLWENAEVILYDNSWNYIDNGYTNVNGLVTFTGI